nr:3-hydroxyisobutyryl-CoA hydrolase [Kwoniella dejecticola CBS 10117]OBR85097.1 3-hydroxyisobutyryl-CoA hydrolase [Kwoniella dejecticola CBS 10117]
MSSPHEDLVLFESHHNARLYKLNRPAKLNSLNQEMIDLLTKKVRNWRELESCKVIIGTGDQRAFCAGGDVKQLVLDLKEGKDTALPFFKSEFELNWTLGRLGKPYVAIIDGVTMGGGAGLSLPADIRIATPKTIFAMPETKIGYAPDVGSNYYLAQLDGAIGAWLAVTGQELYGRAVYELGIATHYVTPNLLPTIINEITQLDSPTSAQISSIVSSYTASAPAGPDSGSDLSSKSNPDGLSPIKGEIRGFLDKTFSLKSIPEIHSALTKSQSDSALSGEVKEWARVQLDLLNARSPTSTAVALTGYRKAKEARRLDRVLLNDITMATAFCGPESGRATDDFVKGVSSVLIDRSKTAPEWIPSELSDPRLALSEIIKNFYPTKSSTTTTIPELQLVPESASKLDSGRDSTWNKFRKYGLPSEQLIKASVDGYSPQSGAFALTEKELIAQFLEDSTSGTRRDEVVQRIKSVVEKNCKVDKGGYLEWK